MQDTVEQCILACLFLNTKACLPVVMKILVVNDFENPVHRVILTAIIKLEKDGKAIDYITVAPEVQKVYGEFLASYLSDLANSLPTTTHIETYCLQLKEFSNKAKLKKILLGAVDEIINSDSETVINDIDEVLQEIRGDKPSEIVYVKDIINAVYDEIKAGKQLGLLTGIKKIDDYTGGFQKQNLIVLASGAGKGKTSLAINFCYNFMYLGKTVLFFSLEMSTYEIVKRLVALVSGVSTSFSNHELWGEIQIADRVNACSIISGYNLFIDDKPQTVQSLAASTKLKMHELQTEGLAVDIVVIDYLQLLSEKDGRNESREREVSAMAYGLKNLAKSLNIPVIALAQTNRLAEREKGRDYKLYDLRESGAIEQAADMVMFLNDDSADDTKFKLDVAKNRHGPTFFINLEFTKSFHKFKEING